MIAALLAAWIAQAPAASITGRVVDDIGAPVGGATVVAIGGPAVPGARPVITSDSGAFALRDVGPGIYTLTVSKPAYVPSTYGASSPGGRGKTFEVVAGQQLTVPLTLVRGAVISGVIVGEDGEPALASLYVTRDPAPAGERRVPQSTRIDSHGGFRVFGLAAGTYRVAPTTPTGPDDPASIPGLTVTVTPGEEVRGLVIHAPPPRPSTYVTVAVTTTDGRPPRSLQVELRRPGQMRQVSTTSRPNADGSRTMTGVFAGQYRVVARGEPYWGSADVLVDGEHPASVTITMSRGVRIRGTVAFDGAARPPRVSMAVAPADADGLMSDSDGASGTVAADGSFVIDGVPPGRYTMRTYLDSRNPWTIGTAMLAGANVADEAFTVARDDVTGVAVTMTTATSLLKGVVMAADGAANAMDVVAFPVEEKYRVRDSRRVAVSRTTVAGEYELHGLPAGSYALAVTTEVDAQALRDPAALGRLRPIATVTIGAGETRTLDLRLR